jgi:predicted transcriptional regulator/transcriptional regulator with XRE-family HTH domain
MTRKAIYMGPRLKRLRRDLGLTQSNMATDLEISPSYVALMERNQRPITADLLLKLAITYRIDIATLADDGQEELNARLQSVLREPFFADIDLPALDIADIAASYPAFGEALLRLHTAFGEEQLALAERQDQATAGMAEGPLRADPVSEARQFLAARRNCFPALDDSAAALAGEVQGIEAMIERLKARHGLTVRFVEPSVILGALRWHDQHRDRVYFSQLLDHPARRFQLALQIALMEAREPIAAIVGEGRFTTDNGRNLARRALTNYWAAALLMPYRAFSRAARKARHDIEALAREFSTSFEQVAHRLTTLQRPGEEGVPFFFLRVDRAGNVSKRLDGAGFPFARHGGACPLWNVHSTFETPGKVITQRLELPDGQRFISIARTVAAGGGAFSAPVAQRSVALACAAEFAQQLVYADGAESGGFTPIGIACHLCHRPQCIARSAPPLGRDMAPDEHVESGVPFAFADR